MLSSKLVSLLKQFDEKEWREFQRFIESSYFNRRPKLKELLLILKKSVPGWDTKKLTNTYVYSKLFPKEAINEKRLIDLRNNMVKLIEKYWLVNKKVQSIDEYHNLALAYHQKGFPNYRDYYFKKSFDNLKKARIDAEDFHSNLFNLSLTKHKIVEEQGKRNIEPNLQKLHDNLDVYFLCTKLKYYCKVLNYQNFRLHNYDISLIDAVLDEATKNKYEMYPSIQIYYHGVLTLLNTNNEENFYALKNLLIQNTSTFSVKELRNMFVLARNYCAKNFNMGKRKFGKEGLDLYKIEMKEDLILVDGEILDSSCRNIIKLALLLDETEWAENFLKNYQPKISEEVFTLSLANVHFHQKKYDEVLTTLIDVDFKEILLALSSRGLILKTFFQLCRTTNNFEYEDKLEAYIDSFNAFLKRKKEVLTKHYLMLYLNFTKFAQVINKLYWQPKLDTDKLAKIHQEILATRETAEWEWLKEISKRKL